MKDDVIPLLYMKHLYYYTERGELLQEATCAIDARGDIVRKMNPLQRPLFKTNSTERFTSKGVTPALLLILLLAETICHFGCSEDFG